MEDKQMKLSLDDTGFFKLLKHTVGGIRYQLFQLFHAISTP